MHAPAINQSIEQGLRSEEAKRRRRELGVIVVTIAMMLVFAFVEVKPPDMATEDSLISNVGFFLLINVNIILFGLLLFLVARNLAKVVWEGKGGARRSRLRWQLVLALVALSLLPNLALFFIAGGFVTRSFDRWFDQQIVKALKGSLEIQETYYQNAVNNAIVFARQLSQRVTREELYEPERSEDLKDFIQVKQREYHLAALQVLSLDRRVLAVSVDEQLPGRITVEPDKEFFNRALRGLQAVTTQDLAEGEAIRGAAPIYGAKKQISGVLVVDYYVPKSLKLQSKQISEFYGQFKRQEILQTPIKYSYIWTLFLITLMIILVAIWFGLYLAKGITVPIQKLAEGTHEVAQGNLDYKLEAGGDDEIGVLVNSFNQMTSDLKRNRIELERRGKFVGTLLANIAAGVISIDPAGKITTWNKAAAQILGLAASAALGKNFAEVFKADMLPAIREIIERAAGHETVEREIQIQVADSLMTVVVIAADLRDEEGEGIGVLLFLEDITQIQKVQRMEAWREVARRIAHEIKNPLTPIQLSAERLRKRYAPLLQGDGAILDKCTSTIITQVEELKNLVNAFAQFDRLPAAELTSSDLNEIVREALFLYQEGHDQITFEFDAGTIPALVLDRIQIKRVIINLLDNAVAAVESNINGHGTIKLATRHDPERERITIEIADNGPGLPAAARARIFEPYFSTKKNGTGLGLSIVSAIVEDHHGKIRVRANEPNGTKFIIELPARGRFEPVNPISF
jgi:two-component system, NtrC family, nitrogen regulation sensor histidine kinase NtrY